MLRPVGLYYFFMRATLLQSQQQLSRRGRPGPRTYVRCYARSSTRGGRAGGQQDCMQELAGKCSLEIPAHVRPDVHTPSRAGRDSWRLDVQKPRRLHVDGHLELGAMNHDTELVHVSASVAKRASTPGNLAP